MMTIVGQKNCLGIQREGFEIEFELSLRQRLDEIQNELSLCRKSFCLTFYKDSVKWRGTSTQPHSESGALASNAICSQLVR